MIKLQNRRDFLNKFLLFSFFCFTIQWQIWQTKNVVSDQLNQTEIIKWCVDIVLGSEKELSVPRLELMAQGVAYQCSKVKCKDHLTIQAPHIMFVHNLFDYTWSFTQVLDDINKFKHSTSTLCWNNALWLVKIVMWLLTSNQSASFQHSLVMLG